jgi:predicted permease
MLQDLRYAVRMLRSNPGFAAVAVLALALGIGANTSIFTVVNAVLIQPLPYPEPDNLVVLWGNVVRTKVERRGTSYPDYADWRDQNGSFQAMAAVTDNGFLLTGVDEPERVLGEFVSAPYFDLLGVRPSRGRTFRPEEDQVPQKFPVVVIGDGFWKRRFGSDPAVIGKSLTLNARSYNIIGVMPPEFRGYSDNAELWVPFMMAGTAQDFQERGSRGFIALARLKPGVRIAQAQVEMDGISKRLEQAYPATNQKRGVEVIRLDRELFGDFRTPLFVLLGAVGFVLLIACANVANLLLARSEARQKEIAIRSALGAGHSRLLRQLITESCLLSLLGAGAGVLLSLWGVQALIAFSPVPFPSFIRPKVDATVAGFTLAAALASGLLLGLAPALHARASALHDVLKEAGGRAGDSRRRQRFRQALVVAEISLALVLLIGAGLSIRSFQRLSAIDPGFDASHLLTLRLNLPAAAPDARTVVSARQIIERVRQVPSVQSVSVASDVPLTGGGSAIFYTAEGQPPVTAQNMPRAYIHRVAPDFFSTLRVPLRAGRTFSETEIAGQSNVVIVSEGVIRRFWPGQDGVGKRVKPGNPSSQQPWLTIIGVVGEMKYRGLPENPTGDPDVYFPFSERQRGFMLLVRTPLDPGSLSSAVRAAIRSVDPTVVVFNVATMTERIGRQTARWRFTGWIMAIFAGLALLLALIGVYGVMSFVVAQRTREIGVRMAMGAQPWDVLRMVLGSAMALIGAGVLAGVALAAALTRLMGTLLYGVSPTDPVTFTIVSLLLVMTGLVATYIPARRATSVDPLSALRYE